MQSTVTRTLAPTRTLAATSTVYPSPTATKEPSRSPTPPGMSVQTGAFQFGKSPEGGWFWGIEGIGTPEEGTELIFHKTNIASGDGKTVWTVWPKTSDIGSVKSSQATYTPIFWPPGEQTVYLAGDSCCQDGAFGHTGMNLARLDLRTGDFTILISGWSPHTFAFSGQGQVLLDTEYNVPRLRFIHLEDWVITNIPVDPKFVHHEIGAFSPDEVRAVVAACEETENAVGCSRLSLLLVDIHAGTYRVLLADVMEETGFNEAGFDTRDVTYEWVKDGEISITARARGKETRALVLDLETDEMRQVEE